MTAKKKPDDQIVRIAPLGELRAYTISEHELERLEQGTAVSDLLTIGLCLLSAALTFFAIILSTPLPTLQFILFFCLLFIFGISGAVCTYLGGRGRRSTTRLAQEIRARMPNAPSIQQVVGAALVTASPGLETAPTPPAQGSISPPPSANP